MMGNKTILQNYRQKLTKINARRELLEEEAEKKRHELHTYEQRHTLSLGARAFAQHVAQKLQSTIEVRINSICTSALESIFYDDPYEFVARFTSRRGKSECDLVFVKGGNEIAPLESSGYGACNVANIGCRLSLWSLNRNRRTFILDEPLQHLSVDRCEDASKTLKELCDRLGIQIIMISHDPEIVNYADKVVEI